MNKMKYNTVKLAFDTYKQIANAIISIVSRKPNDFFFLRLSPN